LYPQVKSSLHIIYRKGIFPNNAKKLRLNAYTDGIMKKSIIVLILILVSIGSVRAITVTNPSGIPLDAEKVKAALVAKEPRLASFDAELLIFSYSTGKSVYSLNKKGDLEVFEELGEIEAVLKIHPAKGGSMKSLFIKGKGGDAASLTESLVIEAVKALTPLLL
jgi:hypothetical protein